MAITPLECEGLSARVLGNEISPKGDQRTVNRRVSLYIMSDPLPVVRDDVRLGGAHSFNNQSALALEAVSSISRLRSSAPDVQSALEGDFSLAGTSR